MPVRRGRRVKWHGRTAMLNKPGFQSTAAICCVVEDSSTWPVGRDSEGEPISKWSTPSYTFQIANCDRSLAWELDFQTPGSRANDMHKLNVLVDTLTKFRDGVKLEQERMVQRLSELND
jgi:hypothetical protein